jgi:hypothetical protein
LPLNHRVAFGNEQINNLTTYIGAYFDFCLWLDFTAGRNHLSNGSAGGLFGAYPKFGFLPSENPGKKQQQQCYSGNNDENSFFAHEGV